MIDIGLLLAAILSLFFIYSIIKYAPVLGLIDTPNERSSHRNPIPKGAGIGFTMAALITLTLLHWEIVASNLWSIGAIFLVMLTGLMDDIKNCRPRFKFTGILIAVLMIYMDDVGISSLGTYFDLNIELAWFLVLPFTYFAVAGFTNALNLIDGIDGLAGGISLVILVTYLVIGIKFDDAFLVVVSAAFASALMIFMVFNWNPARIFMGDSGSLTLGFVIALLSIKALAYINPTIVLFVAAMPLLDTFSVMRRRKQRGQSIFKADKNHLHHILLNQKRDVRFTARMLILIQVVFSMIGYRSIGQDDAWNIFLFGVLFVIFFNLFDPRMRRRKKKEKNKATHPLQIALREDQVEAA